MFFHLIDIGVEETFNSLASLFGQQRSNFLEMLPNVWKPAVEVIVVRAQQVGYKSIHGGAHDSALRWQVGIVAVDLAYEQEELRIDIIIAAYLLDCLVAKSHWNSKV